MINHYIPFDAIDNGRLFGGGGVRVAVRLTVTPLYKHHDRDFFLSLSVFLIRSEEQEILELGSVGSN